MPFSLRNRSFLKELDFTPQEGWRHLLSLAAHLKAAKYAGTERPHLRGKNIALIFEKTSTRTRCAFEVAAFDQGARVHVEKAMGVSSFQIRRLHITRGFASLFLAVFFLITAFFF